MCVLNYPISLNWEIKTIDCCSFKFMFNWEITTINTGMLSCVDDGGLFSPYPPTMLPGFFQDIADKMTVSCLMPFIKNSTTLFQFQCRKMFWKTF